MEVAIDVRRCGDVPLKEFNGDLIRACFGDAEPSRIHLEPWLGLAHDYRFTNPDCGLRHLPADVARSKLTAMVEGTAAVRRTLPRQSGHTQLAEPMTEQ